MLLTPMDCKCRQFGEHVRWHSTYLLLLLLLLLAMELQERREKRNKK